MPRITSIVRFFNGIDIRGQRQRGLTACRTGDAGIIAVGRRSSAAGRATTRVRHASGRHLRVQRGFDPARAGCLQTKGRHGPRFHAFQFRRPGTLGCPASSCGDGRARRTLPLAESPSCHRMGHRFVVQYLSSAATLQKVGCQACPTVLAGAPVPNRRECHAVLPARACSSSTPGHRATPATTASSRPPKMALYRRPSPAAPPIPGGRRRSFSCRTARRGRFRGAAGPGRRRPDPAGVAGVLALAEPRAPRYVCQPRAGTAPGRWSTA